ncbi:MAG: thiamine pyrophosphate-binding protein, partial [Hyphomicrobiales bacterium]
IANAHISRVPLLIISGTPPIFQENRGALQDINHVEIVKSVTRYSKTVRHESLIVNEMNQAFYHALGIIGESGPSFIEFPTNV